VIFFFFWLVSHENWMQFSVKPILRFVAELGCWRTWLEPEFKDHAEREVKIFC